jgi:hypothetical protein
MTPGEYSERARVIVRARILTPHQVADLRLQVALVAARGQSTSLDDYYLDIVGVPPPPPFIMPRRKPKQGGLFSD